jgi:hypothetical protein
MPRTPSFTAAPLLAALVGALAVTSCATTVRSDSARASGSDSSSRLTGHTRAGHCDGRISGVTVTENEVGGDLSCEENSPAPHGEGNHVSGNQEDQCRGL